jgi:hypothetical protein
MMKKTFRRLVGLGFALPFSVLLRLLGLFIGRSKAEEVTGRFVTCAAKHAVRLLVPKIRDASEFDHFVARMKRNSRYWKPFYDFTIDYPDRDTVRLHITNCPFSEALDTLKCACLKRPLCQGDWEVAMSSVGKWMFERRHQIGTGDDFCDHTYRRIPASAD